jgi:hypothetical protein
MPTDPAGDEVAFRKGSVFDWDQLARDWTIPELTVVWAVTPKRNQSYNVRLREVRELATLLDRSPSAVSRKMGNLWAVWKPGSGMSHVSRADRIVVNRYLGKERQLVEDANRIRAEMNDRTLSPRAEGESPESSGGRAVVAGVLMGRATEEGAPEHAVVFYDREGSEIIGFFVEGWGVIQWLGAGAFITVALKLYPWLRANAALRKAQRGDREEWAKDEIKTALPDLHQKYFSAPERLSLAIAVSRAHFEPLRFTRKLSQMFRGVDLDAAKKRIRGTLHVRTDELCPKCTIMLFALTERVEVLPDQGVK